MVSKREFCENKTKKHSDRFTTLVVITTEKMLILSANLDNFYHQTGREEREKNMTVSHPIQRIKELESALYGYENHPQQREKKHEKSHNCSACNFDAEFQMMLAKKSGSNTPELKP